MTFNVEETNLNILFSETNDNVIDCRNEVPSESQSCRMDLSIFEQPKEGDKIFGFFIKMNKVLNWTPDYYNNADELPESMPESLKNHIKERSSNGLTLNVVWVSCEGVNQRDTENLQAIIYISSTGEQGFLGSFFPYKNVTGYMSPVIAAYFKTVDGEF